MQTKTRRLVPVIINGQKVYINPDQIQKKDIKPCHGHDEASETDVHSLGMSEIGDTTFIHDAARKSAFKTNELRVFAKELLTSAGYEVSFKGASAS